MVQPLRRHAAPTREDMGGERREQAPPTPSVQPRRRHAAPQHRDDVRDHAPAGRHRQPDERDDIAAQARSSAHVFEDLLRDREAARAAIRHHRDAEARDASVAAEREASESLIHDVDVPPATPQTPLASIDDMLERRREKTAPGRHPREVGDADRSVEGGGARSAQPRADEWIDLDALLAWGTRRARAAGDDGARGGGDTAGGRAQLGRSRRAAAPPDARAGPAPSTARA